MNNSTKQISRFTFHCEPNEQRKATFFVSAVLVFAVFFFIGSRYFFDGWSEPQEEKALSLAIDDRGYVSLSDFATNLPAIRVFAFSVACQLFFTTRAHPRNRENSRKFIFNLFRHSFRRGGLQVSKAR